LETLSIVAYRQPITRSSIDEIRGVKSDSALVTLVEKGLIKEAGRLEAPGRPIIYVTTDEFLRHFGLESLSMLPELEAFIEENSVKED
jgi:segregation and condensation protein B